MNYKLRITNYEFATALNFIIYYCFLFFFCFSCQRKNVPEIKYNFETEGIVIANEGNFTYGNASLSYLDLNENKIYNDVFYNATNLPIGDIAQSITVWNDNIYVAINNSGKVYIINKKTFEYEAQINELTSPRYIQIINSEKAYITDLYSHNITIFNPITFEKTGTIELSKTSEKMLLYEKYLFVVSWSFSNTLIRIDTDTDEIIDSITVAYQPNSLILDKNNKIWILSDGGTSKNIKTNKIAALTKIEPNSMQIEKVYEFPSEDFSPNNLCINSTGDTLFFLNGTWNNSQIGNGIFMLPISSDNLPTEPIISGNEHLFYSLAIFQNIIYTADAIDYTQNGIIYRYKTNGIKINSFKAGIIPGSFAFKTIGKNGMFHN